MIRFLLLFAILSGLGLQGAAPSSAGPVRFLTRPPYDPHAIDVAVDQNQLNGVLTASDLDDLIEAGRRLFDTKFTDADGAGRPAVTQAVIPTRFKHVREIMFQRASGPDANRCTSCHNDPLPGGAGDFTVNAFTSEGTESADFDSVDAQFSNERNTNHLFGSGLLELLAREMTADLSGLRKKGLARARAEGEPVTVSLISKGISFGRMVIAPDGTLDISHVHGIDADLVVRPFSQKGVFASLRMFTLNALNAHHGLLGEERFGPKMTGFADFDADGVKDEMPEGLVSALVAWQASLPPPVPTPFAEPDWNRMADRGADLFATIGCADCHRSTLPLKSLKFADPGPDDTAGTLRGRDVAAPAIYDFAQLSWAKTLKRDAQGNYLVPVFGDLKRHVIADAQHTHYANELMSQGFVPRDSFITAELWGVADTAPYGHRGDLTTLNAAILAHGGEARAASDAFKALDQDARNDLITYLMTLRMPR